MASFGLNIMSWNVMGSSHYKRGAHDKLMAQGKVEEEGKAEVEEEEKDEKKLTGSGFRASATEFSLYDTDDSRAELIFKTIKKYISEHDIDVICLQEMEDSWTIKLNAFITEFNKDPTSSSKLDIARNLEKDYAPYDCVTLYRSDKIEYTWGDRQNKYSMLCFKKYNRSFCVCNVHLSGNPDNAAYYDQLPKILIELYSYVRSHGTISFVVGDFNRDFAVPFKQKKNNAGIDVGTSYNSEEILNFFWRFGFSNLTNVDFNAKKTSFSDKYIENIHGKDRIIHTLNNDSSFEHLDWIFTNGPHGTVSDIIVDPYNMSLTKPYPSPIFPSDHAICVFKILPWGVIGGKKKSKKSKAKSKKTKSKKSKSKSKTNSKKNKNRKTKFNKRKMKI